MLNRLVLSLPKACELDESEDVEVQTRAVLSMLFEPAIRATPLLTAPNPLTCPNCDCDTMSSRSPYCSDPCREMSAFVRQFRSGALEGSIVNPDRQAALGQKLWYVLGGGYPRRDVLVPAKVRSKVIEREGNKCQQCGAKATTVDHSGSG